MACLCPLPSAPRTLGNRAATTKASPGHVHVHVHVQTPVHVCDYNHPPHSRPSLLIQVIPPAKSLRFRLMQGESRKKTPALDVCMNVCTLALHLRLRGTVISHISIPHPVSFEILPSPCQVMPSMTAYSFHDPSSVLRIHARAVLRPDSHSPFLSHRACQQGLTLLAPARQGPAFTVFTTARRQCFILLRSVPSPCCHFFAFLCYNCLGIVSRLQPFSTNRTNLPCHQNCIPLVDPIQNKAVLSRSLWPFQFPIFPFSHFPVLYSPAFAVLPILGISSLLYLDEIMSHCKQ